MKKTIKKVLAKSPLKRNTKRKSVNQEQRVAEKAYQISERRGFVDGHEIFDWHLAQRIVDAESAYKPNRRKRVTAAIKEAVEQTAYELAEQRGFDPQFQDFDWYLARELVFIENNLALD